MATRTKSSKKMVAQDVEPVVLSKKSTKVVLQRRTWTEKENREVLQYLLSVIQKGKELDKPNASAFYQTAADFLKLENCTHHQVKNQVRNLKTKYGKALEWRNHTGQGVLEVEGEESVKSMDFR